jgi:EEF1A lysine methyltransferase 4
MYDDGFHNITNIDISEVVISFMRTKHESREDMEYTAMDIRNMEFIPDDCFDCIIDKALFDSLLCGENNFDSVQRAVREVYRTLKSGGHYIMVSHGPPNTRMHHLNPSSIRWDVEVVELEKPELLDKPVTMKKGTERGPNHFIYICRK